jgi:hypothetical protein
VPSSTPPPSCCSHAGWPGCHEFRTGLLADIPQCPTRVRSPYQSGHRNRNSGKNPIGLINVTRWIGGVSLVLRAMRLPSIMPQQSARVGPLSHHPLPGKTTRNTEPYGAPGDTDNVPP